MAMIFNRSFTLSSFLSRRAGKPAQAGFLVSVRSGVLVALLAGLDVLFMRTAACPRRGLVIGILLGGSLLGVGVLMALLTSFDVLLVGTTLIWHNLLLAV